MLRITDRPAAHTGAQLHKSDRSRRNERRGTIAIFRSDYEARRDLPPTAEPAITRGSFDRLGDFGHFPSAWSDFHTPLRKGTAQEATSLPIEFWKFTVHSGRISPESDQAHQAKFFGFIWERLSFFSRTNRQKNKLNAPARSTAGKFSSRTASAGVGNNLRHCSAASPKASRRHANETPLFFSAPDGNVRNGSIPVV